MSDYRLIAIQEFLKTLLSDPRCLYLDENVVHCEKLFMVNSVMKWLYNNLLSDDITVDSMKNYLLVINEYLDDNIELFWEDNELTYIKKETY